MTTENIKEVPAKGIKGFLLYSPVDHKHFFRVYDQLDKSKFTDFKICAEDIEIELLNDFNSLYVYGDGSEGTDKNRLDYSSRVLGK
jgi:hypothetical protein